MQSAFCLLCILDCAIAYCLQLYQLYASSLIRIYYGVSQLTSCFSSENLSINCVWSTHKTLWNNIQPFIVVYQANIFLHQRHQCFFSFSVKTFSSLINCLCLLPLMGCLGDNWMYWNQKMCPKCLSSMGRKRPCQSGRHREGIDAIKISDNMSPNICHYINNIFKRSQFYIHVPCAYH